MGRYAIFNGLVYGGGTAVIPNPEGTPTDELHSIQIDEDIYEIVGGGGSGDGYKLEKIFDGNVTTTGNITLNKSISNYDKLLFVLNFTRELSESYITTFNVDVSIFKNIGNYTAARGVLLNDWSKDSRFAQVKYVDDTTIDVDAIQVVSIVEIYGVKLKGSGGSGNQELTSYDTTITTTQYGWWTAEDKDGNILDPDQYELIAVTPIVNNSPSWSGAWDGAFYINSADGVTHRYDVSFVNINDGGYIRTSRTWDVKVIYRDKNAAGGGGGSTVVPNPQEEPTDTLNTIGIDGVVYDIEGGSEGEGVEIYSEDEYIVGKWIDGKKLYQKTYHLAQAITVAGGGTWTDTGINISDIEMLVDSKFSQDIAVWDAINGINDNGILKATILASGSLTVDTITLRYTKTVETPAPAWGGSVTNNYANFIDADNVIYSTISSSTTDTYTATEDCYIMQDIVTGSTVSTVNIDGETVAEYLVSGTQIISYNAFLKKGQVLTVTHGGTAQHTIKVFGITYASGGSSSGSSKIEYSTEEKEVGTWIDGSKIYECTWNFSSPLLITSGNWSDTSIAVADTDIYIIVNCEAISSSGARWTFVSATTDLATTTYVRLLNARNTNVNVKYLTLRYTKTVS